MNKDVVIVSVDILKCESITSLIYQHLAQLISSAEIYVFPI